MSFSKRTDATKLIIRGGADGTALPYMFANMFIVLPEPASKGKRFRVRTYNCEKQKLAVYHFQKRHIDKFVLVVVDG